MSSGGLPHGGLGLPAQHLRAEEQQLEIKPGVGLFSEAERGHERQEEGEDQPASTASDCVIALLGSIMPDVARLVKAMMTPSGRDGRVDGPRPASFLACLPYASMDQVDKSVQQLQQLLGW